MSRATLTGALRGALMCATLVGCSDVSPSSPELADTELAADPGSGYHFIQRAQPLAASETASATLDERGGQIELREAGITLVVPEGALDGPTTIHLRAPAGHALAVEMRPRGLRLHAPAMLEWRAGPFAAPLDGERALVGVTLEGDEELGVIPTEDIGHGFAFPIVSLSGYATASG